MPFLPNSTDLRITFELGTGLDVGILQALRKRGAAEPKDRSYALTGVLQLIDAPLSSRPDYQKSKGQVYRDLFTYLVRCGPSNVSLLLDMRPGGLPGAPSWVFDWAAVSADQESRWFLETGFTVRDPNPTAVAEAVIEDDRFKVRMQDSRRVEYVSGAFDGLVTHADALRWDGDNNGVDQTLTSTLLSLLRWLIRAHHPHWSDEAFWHSMGILLDALGVDAMGHY